MASNYDYLWKALAVAYLAYYVLSPAPVLCASDKPGTVCRNVTQQVVVNETTEEWCALFSAAYCYFYGGCYCNVTREVPKTHVTTVCEGQTDESGNTTTTSLYVSLSPARHLSTGSSPGPKSSVPEGEVASLSANSTRLSAHVDIGETTPTSTQTLTVNSSGSEITSDKIVTDTPHLTTKEENENVTDESSIAAPQLANSTTERARNNSDNVSTVAPQMLNSTTEKFRNASDKIGTAGPWLANSTTEKVQNNSGKISTVAPQLLNSTAAMTRNASDKIDAVTPQQLNSTTETSRNVSDKFVTAKPQLNSTEEESAKNVSHKVATVTAQEFNSTTETAQEESNKTDIVTPQTFNSPTAETTFNSSDRVVTVKPQMFNSTTKEIPKNVSHKVGTVVTQLSTRETTSTATHPAKAAAKSSTSLKTPTISRMLTFPGSPPTAPPTNLPDVAVPELKYKDSEANSSHSLGSDPGNAKTGALGGVFKNLTDPEVAAIAVISSLLFSIILSLTVFFIQRRHRGCVARKEARTQVVQVQRADSEQPEGNAEGEAFLPPSQEQRYINVQPANVAQNVYEQVPQHPPADKAELSLDKGKLSASYMSKPAAATSPEVQDSRPPPTQPVVTPCVPSTSKQNTKPNEPPSFELVVKSPEQLPVCSSQKSLHNAPEEKEEDVTSTSSLRLNLSEDHYESLAPADT